MTVPGLITLAALVVFGGYVAFTRYDGSTRAAERRWRANNRRAQAAGCPCGQLGTHVRRIQVAGSVPSEIWRCADHVDVNAWAVVDGHTTPAGGFGDSLDAWQVGPVERAKGQR